MYYVSLNEEQIKNIVRMEICFGLQRLFGEFSHQIFCFFRNKWEIGKFEGMLPERHISQLLTRSHGLGGTIFDIDHEPEKYNENEGQINFDNLDVRLIHSMANGGAKKTLVRILR